MRGRGLFASPALWVGLMLGALLLRGDALRPILRHAFPAVTPLIYDRAPLSLLLVSQAGLVAVASLAAAAVGLGLAIGVTRESGRQFRAIVAALTAAGQTFPPAAVLAITVPIVGFGAAPTAIALFLYGLLPIVENAVAGLEAVPDGVREAALGMGLSPAQLLFRVELPLAAPFILAGIRVSVTIAIGTATIGATVGALTLGTPIFDGLVANNLPFVIEGAVLVALFAILVDLLLGALDRRLRRHAGG